MHYVTYKEKKKNLLYKVQDSRCTNKENYTSSHEGSIVIISDQQCLLKVFISNTDCMLI